MKNLGTYTVALMFALLLAFGGSTSLGAFTPSIAFAQEATPVQDGTTQQQQPVEEDNDFPWGLLGLLGLAGLAGLRRRPEPVQRDTSSRSTVGVYETPKK